MRRGVFCVLQRRVGVVVHVETARQPQRNVIPTQPLNARTYKITRYWNELGLLLRASERLMTLVLERRSLD